MVRQSNGLPSRRGRGGSRGGGIMGRGRGMRGAGFSGRGIQKPPPLMSRPMPPPNDMRHGLHGPGGPPPRPMMSMMVEFRRMGPPRMPPPCPPSSRGPPNLRMGPRIRGPRPPLRGMMPPPRLRGHSGLLPPPMPMRGPPPGPPRMFRHRPPIHPGMMGPMGMRGRGMPGRMLRGGVRGRGGHPNRGGSNSRKGGKAGRGQGIKGKNTANSPSGELNKPWVTEAMKNEILKKHKLHQKAKKARTKEDWEIFKEHRNKVTTMLREAKLEYIGAHPEEDVEKILAEATNQVSDKDEPKESSSADKEVSDDTAPQVGEEAPPQGAEPMEEGGGTHESQQVPDPDPEIEMNQESVTHTEPETTDQ